MAPEIAKLRVAGYRQFRDTSFDFTDPVTGKALERVCFVGSNGTGKSTVLRFLGSSLKVSASAIDDFAKAVSLGMNPKVDHGQQSELQIAVEFQQGADLFTRVMQPGPQALMSSLASAWPESLNRNPWRTKSIQEVSASALRQAFDALQCIYCPPDSEQNAIGKSLSDVPDSNLDQALQWSRNKRTRFVIGQETISDFWTSLIGLIKERETRQLEHQRKPENRERIVREVEEDFLRENPDVLKEMSEFWRPILERAGLEFDYENAAVPVQLTDNLSAYIRLADSKGRIPYADLSTGIRNFIFKLGHIFTVFRGKPENGGVLLVDEPENSLHPDFLFDLVDYYRRAAPGAQLFMATHSPIVAAQFRPEERFILEFDEAGGVSVRRGVTPEGDDPNDVLLRDFAVRSLYGAKGLEKWKRFRELDHLIQAESDPVQRRVLLKEYMDLGKAYNFSPDEVSR